MYLKIEVFKTLHILKKTFLYKLYFFFNDFSGDLNTSKMFSTKYITAKNT